MPAPVVDQRGSSIWARILCVGSNAAHLLAIQSQLDSELDIVLVYSAQEGHTALAAEGPFDLIISDPQFDGFRGRSFLSQLRGHSPDAERLILAPCEDPSAQAMAASDCRVMRLLVTPCPDAILRDAVWDALLRHRARVLRATAVPRVTPMGGHPCCAYTAPQAHTA